jgi:hypothetical protein
MSKPGGPGVIRASIVIALHFEHGSLLLMLRLGLGGSIQSSQSPVVADKGR